MKQERGFVRKPQIRSGVWIVEIVSGPGPFAPVIETITCPGGRESAFHIYRQVMKDTGRGY